MGLKGDTKRAMRTSEPGVRAKRAAHWQQAKS